MGAIFNVMTNTCAFPALTIQNVSVDAFMLKTVQSNMQHQTRLFQKSCQSDFLMHY